MKKALIATTAILSLNACASVIEGGTQKVNIQTDQNAAVGCELSNARGSWMVPTTPAIVDISRSQSRLNIQCDSANFTGATTNQAGPEAWTFGNILLGGLIGLGIDAATGSMFTYDDTILVPLTSKQAAVSSPAIPDQYYITPQETTPIAPVAYQPSAAGQVDAAQMKPALIYSQQPAGQPYTPQISAPTRAPTALPASQF